jgi:hypothetical protein
MIEDILQGEDTVKFIKFLRLSWGGHAERMQNKEYQKQLQQLQWKKEVTVEGYVTEGEKRLKRI